jgi:hypothetical protein
MKHAKEQSMLALLGPPSDPGQAFSADHWLESVAQFI